MQARPGDEAARDRMAREIGVAAEAVVLAWTRAAESAPATVSAPQLKALLAIDHHGPVNLVRLSDRLGALPSSTSRLCDRLEVNGLVTREAGATDRREVTITLTARGRAVLEQVRQARQAHFSRILAGMTPAERAELLAGLRRFAQLAPPPED
ncbi:DNA-binding MarR family transcriptional regulator [Prauserella shujinwangii]|uniref:DNA-binding MarR family transcriptional regulator n=1 Tax=Prauserella shujinwangii TaxID=1453103 RepID=A0A2T0M009_9PSEU|nr:MarR family transcriptional regulator [Prauserella shujinwangii]PRX49922.1 DNA-binding MarR family transcriptional regulator [Prauserella shujinwangii]